jgi:DNA gyrase inhibitor GyrI
VAFGYSCYGTALFVQDNPDNSQKDDCRYDVDAQDTDEKIETGIMRGTEAWQQ